MIDQRLLNSTKLIGVHKTSSADTAFFKASELSAELEKTGVKVIPTEFTLVVLSVEIHLVACVTY